MEYFQKKENIKDNQVVRAKPFRGGFWVIDDSLYAFPFKEIIYSYGLAKSKDTYAHKKLWTEVRPKKCKKPYNYYPRGRIEITAKGKVVMYINPNVDKTLIPEIMVQFGLAEYPKIIFNNSQHYKCYLDDGWKADV